MNLTGGSDTGPRASTAPAGGEGGSGEEPAEIGESAGTRQVAGSLNAMEIIDVTCSFDGLTALSDISFSVKPGEVIGIIGPNGAGKTTLFNLITGIVKPTSGRIIVLGNDVTGMPPHRIAELGVVRTFQNIRLFENQSVLENVLVGCHLKLRGDVASAVLGTKEYKRRYAVGVERAREALEFFGKDLASRESEPARDLSYPERRRVELARGLALTPRILLLDEPTAGMTPEEAEEVVRGICVLREHGYTVLVIEHRMDVIAGACDRAIVLDHGEKIAEGTPREVVANPEVIQAYLGTGGKQEDAKDAKDSGDSRSSLCCSSRAEGGRCFSERDDLLPDAGPILELKDVHSSYGSVKVLQGVNAEINPGELVVF